MADQTRDRPIRRRRLASVRLAILASVRLAITTRRPVLFRLADLRWHRDGPSTTAGVHPHPILLSPTGAFLEPRRPRKVMVVMVVMVMVSDGDGAGVC